MKKTTITKVVILIIAIILSFIYYSGHSMFQKTTSSKNYKTVNININKFSINFNIPDTTQLHSDQSIPDNNVQILYNSYFDDRKLKMRGYIQVWKTEDLLNFITNCKFLTPFDYKTYALQKINENNRDEFLTYWTATFGQNYLSSEEYWQAIANTNFVIRISFYTDTEHFPTELQNIVHNIVTSVIVK